MDPVVLSCWSDNRRLVAMDGAELPRRCVKCNGSDGVTMRRQTFAWKPAAFLLLGAAGAAVPARQSPLVFGVCRQHRRSNRLLMAAVGGLLVSAFGVIALASRTGKPMWSLGGVGSIIAAAVVWSFTAILSPGASDKSGATVYGGAGKPFLDSLRRAD